MTGSDGTTPRPRRMRVFKDAAGIDAACAERGASAPRALRADRGARTPRAKTKPRGQPPAGADPAGILRHFQLSAPEAPGILCWWRFHCEVRDGRFPLCWPFERSFAQQDRASVLFSYKKVVDFFS